MTPGFSKIILNEVILPATKCPWEHATLDIVMMTSLSGGHRTELQWFNLLAEAGLRDVKVWYPPEAGDGVIEAMRQDDFPLGTRSPTYAIGTDYKLPNE